MFRRRTPPPPVHPAPTFTRHITYVVYAGPLEMHRGERTIEFYVDGCPTRDIRIEFEARHEARPTHVEINGFPHTLNIFGTPQKGDSVVIAVAR